MYNKIVVNAAYLFNGQKKKTGQNPSDNESTVRILKLGR